MQQNVFMEPAPILKLAIVAAGALGAGLLLAALLLAVFSTTWRTRLWSVARHALWIVPVLGLLAAAFAWRSGRSQPNVATLNAGWPADARLTVPETLWPTDDERLFVPPTQSWSVPTTTVQYRRVPVWVLLGPGLAALVLAVVFVTQFVRRRAGALMTVGGVLAALGLFGGAMLTSLVVHEHRGARTEPMQQMEARQVADVLRHRELAALGTPVSRTGAAPSQVLDFRGQPPEPSEELAPPTAPPAKSGSPSLAEGAGAEIVAYVGRDALGERLTELPAWVSGAPKDSDVRVYTSGLWVTTDEAEQELVRTMAPALSQYFWEQRPAAAGWTPSAELCARSGAVARRCYESVPMQFGDHTQTMHRAYWQVRHTPESAQFLFESWRPLAVQQRLVWLGGGVLLLTLLCGAVSAYFRVDAATGGRYRGRLRFATGAVCVAGGVAAILLA